MVRDYYTTRTLHSVFQAILFSRLVYALPTCGSFPNVDFVFVYKTNGFLQRPFLYGCVLVGRLIRDPPLLDLAVEDLF